MQAPLQAGATYYIVVSGYQGDAGAYQINITTADDSVVPSLPLKGRYAVALASSIAASGAINSTVTGETQPVCTSANSTYSLPVTGLCGVVRSPAVLQHSTQVSHVIGEQQRLARVSATIRVPSLCKKLSTG